MEGERRALVAIAHTEEKHRSFERVLGLVREALDHLGGISHFVQLGQTVLLKPNQTVFYSADEGCTTDPLVVGADVSLAGTIGHVKSVLDSMLRRGELNQVIWLKGTPTIMIGDVDDPHFEQHLEEGP